MSDESEREMTRVSPAHNYHHSNGKAWIMCPECGTENDASSYAEGIDCAGCGRDLELYVVALTPRLGEDND